MTSYGRGMVVVHNGGSRHHADDRTPRLLVEDIRPPGAYELEETLRDGSGRILLNAGTHLTPDILSAVGNRFATLKVRKLPVTTVPIDELAPGDTMAETLYDGQRRKILADGTTLESERQIEQLGRLLGGRGNVMVYRGNHR